MRKLVESNLIEKTKNYEEQAYRRWHLQRDESAFSFDGEASTGKYKLKLKQIKPYCESHKAYRWTSGSTFTLELQLPKASDNLSQFRVQYYIETGNKITSFQISNPDNNLVLFWNFLGDGSRRLTYSAGIFPNTSGMSDIVEFYIIIDYMQGVYNIYLTDDPDV